MSAQPPEQPAQTLPTSGVGSLTEMLEEEQSSSPLEAPAHVQQVTSDSRALDGEPPIAPRQSPLRAPVVKKTKRQSPTGSAPSRSSSIGARAIVLSESDESDAEAAAAILITKVELLSESDVESAASGTPGEVQREQETSPEPEEEELHERGSARLQQQEQEDEEEVERPGARMERVPLTRTKRSHVTIQFPGGGSSPSVSRPRSASTTASAGRHSADSRMSGPIDGMEGAGEEDADDFDVEPTLAPTSALTSKSRAPLPPGPMPTPTPYSAGSHPHMPQVDGGAQASPHVAQSEQPPPDLDLLVRSATSVSLNEYLFRRSCSRSLTGARASSDLASELVAFVQLKRVGRERANAQVAYNRQRLEHERDLTLAMRAFHEQCSRASGSAIDQKPGTNSWSIYSVIIISINIQ